MRPQSAIRTIEDDQHGLRSVTSYYYILYISILGLRLGKIGTINGKPMTEDQIKQFEEDWKDPNWVACSH